MSKFYPLNNEEWAEVRTNLKPSEIVVLFHLKTLDPFCDRMMRIDVKELAKELKMGRSTCSHALKTLSSSGYITLGLETVVVSVRKSSQSGCPEIDKVSQESTSNEPSACPEIDKLVSNSTSSCQIRQANVKIDKVTPIKAIQREGSGISHTLKTNKTIQINQEIEFKNSEISDPPTAQVPESITTPTEAELYKFVRNQIESKGIEMRNPEVYVKTAIDRDRANWIGQWQEHQRASRPVAVYKPEVWTPPDREAGLRALAEAKARLGAKFHA
jgi:hypothetical protein